VANESRRKGERPLGTWTIAHVHVSLPLLQPKILCTSISGAADLSRVQSASGPKLFTLPEHAKLLPQRTIETTVISEFSGSFLSMRQPQASQAGQPFLRRFSRPLAAAGAILTCPCHAVALVFVLSGTSLGAFLFQRLFTMMIAMGALFLLSIWLLWQTRDTRTTGFECPSCPAATLPGLSSGESRH
jgi:hypothetical protein